MSIFKSLEIYKVFIIKFIFFFFEHTYRSLEFIILQLIFSFEKLFSGMNIKIPVNPKTQKDSQTFEGNYGSKIVRGEETILCGKPLWSAGSNSPSFGCVIVSGDGSERRVLQESDV